MNDPRLTQLKIIVERAVRPVRASFGCKQKMREELLAHVVGVFEEEAKLGDEQAALARTHDRFGQAAELKGQLQASVPRSDRLDRFAENLLGGEGRSVLRMAAGLAVAFGLLGCIPLGVIVLLHGRLRGDGYEWFAPSWIAFLAFCCTLLAGGMRQALFGPAGRSWLRAGLFAASAWIVFAAAVLAVFLAVMSETHLSLWEIVPALRFGLLAPLAPVALVYLFSAGSEPGHDREWAHLDIG
jgi:hypothetical protein